MHKKISAWVFFSLGLACCQGWVTPAITEPQNTPTHIVIQNTTQATIPIIETAPSTSSQVLTIWVPPSFDPNGGSAAGKLLGDHLATFIDHMPGTKINIRVKATGGPGGMMDALVTTRAAAPLAMPSLVALSQADLETAALKGLAFPITDMTTVLEDEDWYNFSRDLSKVENTSFGLPFGGDALLILYRSTSSLKNVSNWKDVFSQNLPLLFPAADSQALLTLQLYLSAGGSLTNEKGQPSIQPEILTEVLNLFANGAQQGIFPFSLTQFDNYDQTWQAYAEQRFNWTATWNTNYLMSQQPDSTPILIPSMTGEPFALANGWVWAITDPLPQRREASLRLAEFLVEAGFLSDWSSSTGLLPVRPSSLGQWPDSEKKKFIDSIARSAVVYPTSDIMITVGPILQEATMDVIKLQYNPTQAAKNAVEKLMIPDTP